MRHFPNWDTDVAGGWLRLRLWDKSTGNFCPNQAWLLWPLVSGRNRYGPPGQLDLLIDLLQSDQALGRIEWTQEFIDTRVAFAKELNK